MSNVFIAHTATEFLRVLYVSRNKPEHIQRIFEDISSQPSNLPQFSLYQISQLALLARPMRTASNAVVRDSNYDEDELDYPDLPERVSSKDDFEHHMNLFGRAIKAREYFAQELAASYRNNSPQYTTLFSTTWWTGFADNIDEIEHAYGEHNPFSIMSDYLGGISYDSYHHCPHDGSPIEDASLKYLSAILDLAVKEYTGNWETELAKVIEGLYPEHGPSENNICQNSYRQTRDEHPIRDDRPNYFNRGEYACAKANLLHLYIEEQLKTLTYAIQDLDDVASDETLRRDLIEQCIALLEKTNELSEAIDVVLSCACDNQITCKLSDAIEDNEILLYPNLYRLIAPINSLIFATRTATRDQEQSDPDVNLNSLEGVIHLGATLGYASEAVVNRKFSQLSEALCSIQFLDTRSDNCDFQDYVARQHSKPWATFFDEYAQVVSLFSPNNEGPLELPRFSKDKVVIEAAVRLSEFGSSRISVALFACWLEIRRHSPVIVQWLRKFLNQYRASTLEERTIIDIALHRYCAGKPGLSTFLNSIHPLNRTGTVTSLASVDFIRKYVTKEGWLALSSIQQEQLIKAEDCFRRLKNEEELASEVILLWGIVIEAQCNYSLTPVRKVLRQIDGWDSEPRARLLVNSKWSLNELVGLFIANKRRDFFSNSKFDEAWNVFDRLALRTYIRSDDHQKELLRLLGSERNRASHDNPRPPLKGTASYFRLHLFQYGIFNRVIMSAHGL